MAVLEANLLKLYESIVDHPKKWLLAWVGIILAFVIAIYQHTAGFTYLEYNNGPYLYFTEDNEEFQTLMKMEKTYSPDTSLMFVYSVEEGDIFNQESLSAIAKITELSWTLPHVLRVDSIANFQHTKVTGDELFTDYLYQEDTLLTAEKIDYIESVVMREKTLLKQTVALDGKSAAIIATVTIDEAQTQALDILPQAKALAATVQQAYPNGTIRFLGDVPYAVATDSATKETFSETTPIAMTLVLICLFILLRNFYSVMASQLIITLSIALGYIVFILSGCVLSPISAGASPIILTLAVADCVHMLVSYQQQCGIGKNKRDAMLESLRLNFSPVWLTSITTGVGFLMMNFADSPPFHDLGNAVFIGVMMAFVLSVFLLPPLMMLLPKPNYEFGNSQKRYMNALAGFTLRARKPLLAGMSVLVVVLIAFIPQNRVNDIMTEYFDETYEVRRALDFYLENLGGIQRLAYTIPARGENGVTEPEYLKNIDRLVTWAEQQSNVSHVRSFAEVVKRLNRDMHAGDEGYYKIPDSQELIAQYVLLYELGLPFGLGLDNQISIGKSESKLEIVFHRVHSDEIVRMRKEINAWIEANWPEYMHAKATGMDSLFSDITFANVYSMMIGTIVALVMVSCLLILSLGSVRYGLLSLLPNLLPAAMTFGFWAIIHGEVGVVVSIISCMTLGIIIDDTVHFLSKYVRAKREMGLDAEAAAVYAFETVGVALIATSIILVANFGVMGFSNYYPNSATGILTSMTITSALVIHFFFFVPLLLTLDSKRKQKADDNQTSSDVLKEEEAKLKAA